MYVWLIKHSFLHHIMNSPGQCSFEFDDAIRLGRHIDVDDIIVNGGEGLRRCGGGRRRLLRRLARHALQAAGQRRALALHARVRVVARRARARALAPPLLGQRARPQRARRVLQVRPESAPAARAAQHCALHGYWPDAHALTVYSATCLAGHC